MYEASWFQRLKREQSTRIATLATVGHARGDATCFSLPAALSMGLDTVCRVISRRHNCNARASFIVSSETVHIPAAMHCSVLQCRATEFKGVLLGTKGRTCIKHSDPPPRLNTSVGLRHRATISQSQRRYNTDASPDGPGGVSRRGTGTTSRGARGSDGWGRTWQDVWMTSACQHPCSAA